MKTHTPVAAAQSLQNKLDHIAHDRDVLALQRELALDACAKATTCAMSMQAHQDGWSSRVARIRRVSSSSDATARSSRFRAPSGANRRRRTERDGTAQANSHAAWHTT